MLQRKHPIARPGKGTPSGGFPAASQLRARQRGDGKKGGWGAADGQAGKQTERAAEAKETARGHQVH